jgi:hypothetical protein
MAQSTAQPVPPLVDDVTVKDVFADTCAGVSVTNSNLHLTFASVTNDYSIEPAQLRRIVTARLVMPMSGMIELRDILSRMIDRGSCVHVCIAQFCDTAGGSLIL